MAALSAYNKGLVATHGSATTPVATQPCQAELRALLHFLPACFAVIVREYLGRFVLSAFVDFSNLETLRKHLGNPQLDRNSLNKAHEIAMTLYQAPQRAIAGGANGYAIPMDAEALAYVMRLAQGKVVVEFGGADGKMAILLAFAGARQVYMNEIDPTEMDRFQRLRSELPSDIAVKLEGVKDSCFDFLKSKPELNSRVDLIVCRNLIHFFNDQQQNDLLRSVKSLLKPGGRALFTTNSIYSKNLGKTIVKDNPGVSAFSQIALFVDEDNQKGTPVRPSRPFFRAYFPCPAEMVLMDYTKVFLFRKDKTTGYKLIRNEKSFDVIYEDHLEEINKVISEIGLPQLNQIASGRIRLWMSSARDYSRETIEALFKSFGFDCELTFAVSSKGHLVNNDDWFNRDNLRLGIIISRT